MTDSELCVTGLGVEEEILRFREAGGPTAKLVDAADAGGSAAEAGTEAAELPCPAR
jgi:hypothetical protein